VVLARWRASFKWGELIMPAMILDNAGFEAMFVVRRTREFLDAVQTRGGGIQ
jgi:hypothetical protein